MSPLMTSAIITLVRFDSQVSEDDIRSIMTTNIVPMPFYTRPYMEIEPIACPQCSKMFTPKVGGGGRLQKFCSTHCLQEYRAAHVKCNDPWQTDWRLPTRIPSI